MLFKIQLLLFISIYGKTCAMTVKSNCTSNNILEAIEENQVLGMDCSIYSNSIETFINEYKQMYRSLTIACQLHLKSTTGKLKSTVDAMVEEQIEEYLASIEVMKSKLNEIKKHSLFKSIEDVHDKYESEIKSLHTNNNNLTERIKQVEGTCRNYVTDVIREDEDHFNDVVLLIRSGQFSLGREQVSQFGEIYLIKIINAVYGKNIADAEKLIEFFNSFPDEDSAILGYRLLFDQMKVRNQISSTATTTIGYRVFVEFAKGKNENLLHLKRNLAESLQKLPWNEVVVVRNAKLNQLLFRFWSNAPCLYDNLRSKPYVQNIAADMYNKVVLIPVSNGKYFYIKSVHYDFYLYADTDEFALDSQRRSVFMWMKNNEIRETGRWQFEAVLGSQYFKIKNIYWNEYLTIAEDVKVKGESLLQLFTLSSGRCDSDLCKWHITKYAGN